MNLIYKKGFTLVEVMTVVGIVSMIGVGIGVMAFEGMRLWDVSQNQVEILEDVRLTFTSVVNEIREAIISDNGSYPIEQAQPFSMIFYANVDGDIKREKIKYELQGTTLYRWEVEADDGEPAQYPQFVDNQKKMVAENVLNDEYVFRYYDSSYNGMTDPLAEPFDLNEISLVQVRLVVDNDPNELPEAIEIETNISLRNLKYKYDN